MIKAHRRSGYGDTCRVAAVRVGNEERESNDRGAMPQPPRAILAIDTTPFARSLSLLAVIRALRIELPQTFIAVAAATATSQLLMAASLADETIDLGVIKAQHGGDGLKRLARLFKRARHRDYDLVLDFSPKVDTQVLS